MKQAKWFLLLHIILGIYAGSSVCSKLAAQQPFLSAAFIVLYGLMLLALVVYAVGWQQVIKRLWRGRHAAASHRRGHYYLRHRAVCACR